MGWKGTLRTAVAAHRRAVRAEVRAAREARRAAAEEIRAKQQAAAEQLVARYELQLKMLATVHQECGPTIDWAAIARTAKPEAPQVPSERCVTAEAALSQYRPGFFARLFGTAARTQSTLRRALEDARSADEEAAREHAQACTDWQTAQDVAAAVLASDASRYPDALEGAAAFDELEDFGGKISIAAANADVVMVEVTLPAAEVVVPGEQFSVTQRGKLSTKNMPKTRRHEIYQDYVCGAALRAARETLAALPIQTAGVTIRCPLLDASTGHTREVPVLSVFVPRVTAETLNYEALDPSDAMSNFVHRMGFKKSAGMSSVSALTLADALVAIETLRSQTS